MYLPITLRLYPRHSTNEVSTAREKIVRYFVGKFLTTFRSKNTVEFLLLDMFKNLVD